MNLINKLSLCFSLSISILFSTTIHAQRAIILFDSDWKFIKEDIKGAEKPNFNDAAWKTISVPHDWSIEYPISRSAASGRGGGFVETGVGWYRRSFILTESYVKRRLFIEFDGVMMNSDVWINGVHLGKRPYGYSSFQYELTGHLNFGKDKKNTIAVRADNSLQPASRWYTGSGIYRHVRLVVTNPVHIDHWGTFITTPVIKDSKATVHAQTTMINQSAVKNEVTLETTIFSPEGQPVKVSKSTQAISAGESIEVKQDIVVDNPQLWNLDKTNLYKAVSRVSVGNTLIDSYITTFGIRTIHFEASTGFWLNGINLKIKGVCLHQDGGAVGTAVPLRVMERRLELLKTVGVNAIRTSHNPVAPEFLDLCDKMGFLVMDETFDTWNAKKSSADNGYNLYFNDWWERDTHDQVVRDRNHPSIILYSVGNEIHDNLNDESGFKKYTMQQDLIHSLDPTRNVTMALFRPALSHVYENGLADKMDVVGQNYRENELAAAHESKPTRKVIGTENGHTMSAWLSLRDKPYVSGQFLWTGFDYLGEADWPAVVNGQGLFDRTGGPRNIAFQRQSWWNDKPMVYAMRADQNAGVGGWVSDWTPTDIDTYDDARIQVYSNCEEVELFLNGKSHGVKTLPADHASPYTWQLTFEKGTLKAVAKNNGQIVATQELKTAGVPAKIILKADKIKLANNWDDVSYVTATITDENDVPCLAADNQLTFQVSGAGVLAATDNSDLTSTESFLSPKRFVYKGTCIGIVKATAAGGKIIIKVSAQGLKESSIVIETIEPDKHDYLGRIVVF